MTSTNTTRDDGTLSSREQNKTFEHLSKALDADESDEKNYHIREALQLLNVDEY